MRRKALIVLLALGTVGGYASGFASMRSCHNQRRASFEQHVAKVCVDAARASDAAAARAQAQPAPQAATPVIVNIHPGVQNAPVVSTAPAAPAAPAAQ
jgi:tetrahydrodipicolinate N-succinyltransferase